VQKRHRLGKASPTQQLIVHRKGGSGLKRHLGKRQVVVTRTLARGSKRNMAVLQNYGRCQCAAPKSHVGKPSISTICSPTTSLTPKRRKNVIEKRFGSTDISNKSEKEQNEQKRERLTTVK
jgi:hypothetical protein